MGNIGLVSQTGLRLSQDLAIVQLGHLSTFYEHAFEEKNTDVYLEALTYFKIS